MSTASAPPRTDPLDDANELLAAWAAEQPSGLYSRQRVIDHLLDLRNALPAVHRPVVDVLLSDVPGVTVVEATWWLQRISVLQTYLEHPVSS